MEVTSRRNSYPFPGRNTITSNKNGAKMAINQSALSNSQEPNITTAKGIDVIYILSKNVEKSVKLPGWVGLQSEVGDGVFAMGCFSKRDCSVHWFL